MDAAPLVAWMAGRPKPLALFAAQLAVAAESCHEVIRCLRIDHALWRPYCGSESREWVSYYRSNRLLLSQLGRALGWREERIAYFIDILKASSWFSRADRDTVRATVQEIVGERPERFMRHAIRRNALNERVALRCVTSDDDNGFFGDVDWTRFSQQPATQFYLRVAFPCLMLFGRWPSWLLHSGTRLCRPNLKHLAGLIRLDKRVLRHKLVERLLHSGSWTMQRSRQDAVARAIRARPPVITRKQIKNRLGRLMVDVHTGLGHRFTATDVASLFHAVAAGEGLVRDVDIAHSPESRCKGIQREMLFWQLPKRRTSKS